MMGLIKTLAIGGTGGLIVFILILGVVMIYDGTTLKMAKYNAYEKGVIKHDKILNLVAELCGSHNTEVSQVSCITNFYADHYDYDPHNNSFKTASQFLDDGGVCRDFAINVCATVEELNISCQYTFTEGHVFPLIEFSEDEEYMYCIYDEMWWCKDNAYYERGDECDT